jgi:hypothetical protein
VTERERAQERAKGGGRHHPVTEHLGGGASTQHVGVVDAVGPSHQRMHQCQDFAPGPVRAWAFAEVDQLVHDCLDAESLGERRGQQQTSVGDGVVVTNATARAVGLCEDGIEKVPSEVGDMAGVATTILPTQRAFLITRSAAQQHPARWIEA